MRWGLSFMVRRDLGGRDVAIHLSRDARSSARVSLPVRVATTLFLTAPLLWAIGGSVVHLGVVSSGASGTAPVAIRLWAFAGPVAALALNLWWTARVHVSRKPNAVSREVSFALDLASIALILLAGFLVVAFYGHLLADAWACSNGVRSAC